MKRSIAGQQREASQSNYLLREALNNLGSIKQKAHAVRSVASQRGKKLGKERGGVGTETFLVEGL